jgi:hypothetical protein
MHMSFDLNISATQSCYRSSSIPVDHAENHTNSTTGAAFRHYMDMYAGTKPLVHRLHIVHVVQRVVVVCSKYLSRLQSCVG